MRDEQRKEIQELIEMLTEHHLHELEFERKDVRIRIKREPIPAAVSPAPVQAGQPDSPVSSEVRPELMPAESSRFVTVTSPIVGTFYRSPSPDAEPYVEEGDLVKKGQVLCIVDAMKLMNEIESEADGRVVKILIESGTPVEYGHPLFLIDPVVA